jgi:chromosome segregation ATPase
MLSAVLDTISASLDRQARTIVQCNNTQIAMEKAIDSLKYENRRLREKNERLQKELQKTKSELAHAEFHLNASDSLFPDYDNCNDDN